jgi:hypothetical protein
MFGLCDYVKDKESSPFFAFVENYLHLRGVGRKYVIIKKSSTPQLKEEKVTCKDIILNALKIASYILLFVIPLIALIVREQGRAQFIDRVAHHFTHHFTIEDVQKLSLSGTYHFGLRHVSDRVQLAEDAWEGVKNGCSVNLSFVDGYQYNWPGSDETKVEFLEKGVDHFITGSIKYDLGEISLRQTTLRQVVHAVNKCCFSILRYDKSKKPVDLSSWGDGLGRYAKENIESHRVVMVPVVESHHLGISDAELDQVITTRSQGDQLYSRMVTCYRSAILKTIREKI